MPSLPYFSLSRTSLQKLNRASHIGGAILTSLVKSDHAALKQVVITCLVRGGNRITELRQAYGDRVNPVLYQSLDDVDRTIEITAGHDIVIHTTLGYHPESAAALVKGLAKRKQSTGNDVWMIHTSGTSNLADQPITKDFVENEPERVFDDSKEDIYGYEEMRNKLQPYAQRTSERGVIDTGLALAVKTLIVMPPTIYGRGTGHFNKSSVQIPSYVQATISTGQAIIVGEGNGVNGNVHVEDLAELYTLCVLNILEKAGKDLPTGKRGIIFSETALHHWRDIAQGVADAAFKAGKIQTPEVKSVSLEEAARVLTGGDTLLAELGFSSNSRTRGTIARKSLGWEPTRSAEAWRRGFEEEVEAAGQRGSINYGH